MKLIFGILLFIFQFAAQAQPTVQWQKTFGGTRQELGRVVRQTEDGGYLVVTRTSSNDGDIPFLHGVIDFYILRLDAFGELIWQKTFGGSHHDWPYSAVQTPDGNFVIAGFTQSTDGDVTGLHGNEDAWVIKIDPDGNLLWQRAIGGSDWDEAWSVANTAEGGLIICGRSASIDGDAAGNPGGSLDYWIVKLSSEGAIEWQRAYGGSDEDTAKFIAQTQDGGYIVTGEAKSMDRDVVDNNGNVDMWTFKLDSQGQMVWQNSLGGAALDSGTSIYEIPGGYIGGGYAGSANSGDISGGNGFFDYWVYRLDTNGELVWQRAMGGSGPDWLYAATLTADGNFVVGGPTRSDDGDILFTHGEDDIWLIKMDLDGNVLWQKSVGGSSWESCHHIGVTQDGGYILTGITWSTDGDASGSEHKGYGDLWVVKLSADSVSRVENPIEALGMFPNPATAYTFLQLPEGTGAFALSITDSKGKTVLQQNTSEKQVPLHALPPGQFFIKVTTKEGKQFAGKLLKQ